MAAIAHFKLDNLAIPKITNNKYHEKTTEYYEDYVIISVIMSGEVAE